MLRWLPREAGEAGAAVCGLECSVGCHATFVRDHRRPRQLPARPSNRRQRGEAPDLTPGPKPLGGEIRWPPAGRNDGHQWGISWPPVGRNRWPLTFMRRFSLVEHERKSWGLSGMALELITAPVYVTAAAAQIAGRRLVYVVTAKGSAATRDSIRSFRPHLSWAAVAGGSLIAGVALGHSYPSLYFWAGFALLVSATPVALLLAGRLEHARFQSCIERAEAILNRRSASHRGHPASRTPDHCGATTRTARHPGHPGWSLAAAGRRRSRPRLCQDRPAQGSYADPASDPGQIACRGIRRLATERARPAAAEGGARSGARGRGGRRVRAARPGRGVRHSVHGAALPDAPEERNRQPDGVNRSVR